ncbi:MAG: carboxylesterase family protein [Phycisphaerae bacterium]|nr:carboxylesterase family protein [Phycisphaerae bacterium]
MALRRLTVACCAAMCLGLGSCGVLCCLFDLPTASTPTFSVEAGTYSEAIEVEIACETPGAIIRYTTDGSLPTRLSPIHDGQAIRIDNHVAGDNDPDPNDEYEPLQRASMVLRAAAYKEGPCHSEAAEAAYVIDKVDGTYNIAYDEPPPAGGGKHLLDVYQPHGKTGTKVVFFVYGGAWKQGDKNIYMELGNTFAGYYDYTTVIINYQLSAEPWNAVHPTHMIDVAKAFAWVHEHIAEYGGDPNQIYVFGQSAGAHLASLLATDGTYLAAHGLSPADIKAVISMSGAYDLYDLVQTQDNPLGMSPLLAIGYQGICLNAFGAWDQATLDAASPATYAAAGQPPFLIIYAWEDLPGFGQEALNFHEQLSGIEGVTSEIRLLEESDIPAEVLELDFTGHGLEIYAINTRDWDSVSTQVVVEFVEGH